MSFVWLQGAESSKDVYIMSGNASDYVEMLSEEYRLIDRRHEQCGKMAERSYIQSTADNYRHLQNCLENGNSLKPRNVDSEPNPTPTTMLNDHRTDIDDSTMSNWSRGEVDIVDEEDDDFRVDIERRENEPVHEIVKKLHNSQPMSSLDHPSVAYRIDDRQYKDETMNSMPISTVTAKTATQKIANLINKLLH